ncbi:MAG: HK97 gp10 family phage protein [Clostridium sp.]|nr:HK97 gp10 family phage protein [Clostridium sp.]
MNSNRKYNEAAVKQFRKELLSMLGDIEDIDKKVLNKSVNKGVAYAKENTPVGLYSNQVNFTTKDGKEVSFTIKNERQGGFLRGKWRVTRTSKSKKGVSKTIYNNVDYASHVNYGHRIVNKFKETIGWVKGQFILEKTIGFIERQLVKDFKEEVERINKKHDK